MSDIARPSLPHDPRPLPPPGIEQPAEPGLSLVVEGGMTPVGAGHTGAVIGIGMAILLLLNAQGLWNWASKLPANPLAEWVFALSQWWLDLMDRLGLTDVMTALRGAFEFLRNL